MLITVTTSSQTLDTILTTAQKQQMGDTREGGVFNILIQNLGAEDIYLDFGAASTLAAGVKISQGESFSMTDKVLGDANLIADGGNNADVRVISN